MHRVQCQWCQKYYLFYCIIILKYFLCLIYTNYFKIIIKYRKFYKQILSIGVNVSERQNKEQIKFVKELSTELY